MSQRRTDEPRNEPEIQMRSSTVEERRTVTGEPERRPQMRTEPTMEVRRTWRPTVGGILSIIAGVINILAGAGVVIGLTFLTDLYNTIGFDFSIAGIPLIVLGALSVIGGIFALMRSTWWLALIGAIAAVIPSPGWLFGIPALIFISWAKPEFDYRDRLTTTY